MSLIAFSSSRNIKILNLETFKLILTLKGHNNIVTSVCFSPDNTRIISGSWDNTARIWDSNTGECINTLFDHTGTITSVCFSPDGNKIVS